MEAPTFQKETALSTAYNLVYAGPIESLAANVGYMCWDEWGKPERGIGWVFCTELTPVGKYKGKDIAQGMLGFDIEKTKAGLMQLGLITGKESVNYCDWMPPSPIRFRYFSKGDNLIDDNDKFSKKDLQKSLRSVTKGALETYVSSFTIIKEPDGKERRSGIEPGWIGIPPCWGELLGKYLLVRNYYVLGNNEKYSELANELREASSVLSDIKFKINGDTGLIKYSQRDAVCRDHAFQIKADVAGERDWAIEHFQSTLEKIRGHSDFREALEQYSQLSIIQFGSYRSTHLNPSAVIRSQKQIKESPYNPDLGEMVFRHYDIPLSRMAKVAEKDKEIMRLLRLV